MWYCYVYKHYRLSDNVVFYVGKGTSKTTDYISHERAYEKSRGQHWKNVANKHGYRVEIFASCRTQDEAHRLEMELIVEIGRLDLKTGPLVNKTNGGEGASRYVLTEEQKEIRRQKMKQQHIDDPGLKIRAAAGRTRQGPTSTSVKKGQKLSPEWRANMGKAKLGPKNPHFGKPTPISRKVINTKTGIIYPSIPRAAKADGIEDVYLLYRCLFGWRTVNLYPHIQLVQDGV
jgi:hypothetical protein